MHAATVTHLESTIFSLYMLELNVKFLDNKVPDYLTGYVVALRSGEGVTTPIVKTIWFRSALVMQCDNVNNQIWIRSGPFFMEFSHLFLPRCMECRRGIAMGILSVRLSVRLCVRQMRAL